MQNRNEVPEKYLRWSVLGEIVNRGSLLTIFPKNLPVVFDLVIITPLQF